MYQSNGVLLSNDELIHYTSGLERDGLSNDLKAFIGDSERIIQEDLELDMETLAEAEKNRDEAVASKEEAEKSRNQALASKEEAEQLRAEAEKNRDEALSAKEDALASKEEAEELRKESEKREKKLKVLYEELAEKSRISEQELIEERKSRQAERTLNFQRALVFVLGGLIALDILLAHINIGFGGANDELLDLNRIVIIVLLQIFGMATSLFLARNNESKEKIRAKQGNHTSQIIND